MKGFHGGVLALAACFIVLTLPGYAQIPTSPCTTSMISSFTPCVNYLTNSSGSGSSPTADCCNALRSLMSNGTDCLCQIVTGGVPFRLPINRTMAISLPRACNQPGVPVQCQGQLLYCAFKFYVFTLLNYTKRPLSRLLNTKIEPTSNFW